MDGMQRKTVLLARVVGVSWLGWEDVAVDGDDDDDRQGGAAVAKR